MTQTQTKHYDLKKEIKRLRDDVYRLRKKLRIRIGEYRHYGIQSPSFNRSLIYAVKDTTIIHPKF